MFAVTKVNSSILVIIMLAIIIGTKLTKKRNPLHFQRTISMNSQFYAVKTWLAADLGLMMTGHMTLETLTPGPGRVKIKRFFSPGLVCETCLHAASSLREAVKKKKFRRKGQCPFLGEGGSVRKGLSLSQNEYFWRVAVAIDH